MIKFVQKHIGKMAIALASLFWTACETDDPQPLYGVSYPYYDDGCAASNCSDDQSSFSVQIESNDSQADRSSSSEAVQTYLPVDNNDGISVIQDSAASSSSEATQDTPIQCFSAVVQNKADKSVEIFECDNGSKNLKDARGYTDEFKKNLPDDVQPYTPVKSKDFATNCTESTLCVDAFNPITGEEFLDENGQSISGCSQTLECPPKVD